MKITFDNKKLFLNSDGSIFWEDEKVLILTDLHLEKGSSYANSGNYLPPYDSLDTLIKLVLVFINLIFLHPKYPMLDRNPPVS